MRRLDHCFLRSWVSSLATPMRVKGKQGESKVEAKPPVPATLRRVHATLHRALRDAVKWNLLWVQDARVDWSSFHFLAIIPEESE